MCAMSFAAAQADFFAEFFRLYPVNATEAGNHDHDDRWPDMSDAGTGERLAWLADVDERASRRLEGLSREEEIDRTVLLGVIDELRFEEEELDEPSWSAITYSYLLGGGLFAPAQPRVRAAAGSTGQRRGSHGGDRRRPRRRARKPDLRPRPRRRHLPRREGDRHDARRRRPVPHRGRDGRGASTTPRFAPASRRPQPRRPPRSTPSSSGCARTCCQRAHGDFRLGRDLYERKFAHALKATITPAELESRAAATYDEVRAEMLRLARELWPTWVGDEPMPDDPDALTRRVLDAIGQDHPKADELLDFCREEHRRIEEFIRERDLIGLAEEPLQIIWTPPFLRAFGGAMLIPPGPLDKGLDSFFAITPPPEDWTDEQVESMLRENNSRSLRVLTIHEAVPGHYLQLAWSNRCESLARSVFGSGVFAEGWAVYVTQVMMDVGYGADDPALMLAHWKYFLRAATNTLMDIRIHTGTMTEDEAMALMVEGGFQEESEAREKWSRARLSSTQLCSYYLGSVEMGELEAEARRREGDGFTWRPFLESVISHGTPPMPVIRDILSGAVPA